MKDFKESSRITVGMVTFNRWKYSQTTLLSYFKNSSKETELIIVDNASTDETKEKLLPLVEKRKKKGWNIKFIANEKNVGIGRGINQAFEAGSGEIVVKLDNDLVVCPDWLYYLWTTVKHFGKDFGVCCLQIYGINKAPLIPQTMTKGKLQKLSNGVMFEHTLLVNGATMTLTRDFWSKHKFKDDRFYGHEDALMARTVSNAKKIHGQLRSDYTWAIHLQGDDLYRGYDLWKLNTITLGRGLDFKKDRYCIPVEGHRVIEVDPEKKPYEPPTEVSPG